jgi:hypothetical protein
MGVEDEAANGPDQAIDYSDESNDQEGGERNPADVRGTGVLGV